MDWNRHPQRKADHEYLIAQDEFKRFLFDIIDASAMTRSTREEPQSLFNEGRRSLGCEILDWFSAEALGPFDVIQQAIESRHPVQTGATHGRRDDPDE